MTQQAGKLRHRIRIEERVPALDSAGDVVQDAGTGEVQYIWQLFANAWAAISPLSAREFIASQTTQAQIVARISIRYREDLNAAMRIVHIRKDMPDKIYNPHGFLSDVDSGLEYMTIPCSEGVSDTGQ